MTERQEEILEFIRQYQQDNHLPPSTRIIQRHFGFSSQNSVMSHLRALASKQQVSKLEGINQPAPSGATERRREHMHGKVRETIDDADDVLIKPFAGVVTSGSVWAKRGVSALLALLVYGVLARFLIAYLPGRL